MFKPIKHIVVFLICTTFILSGNQGLFAQEAAPEAAPEPAAMTSGPQPPMQNVFYNVLWGSVAGGMVLAGWSMLDDGSDGEDKDERYTLSSLTKNFIVGATYGGLVGLFSGIYFSVNGIEFDESRSRIAQGSTPAPSNRLFASNISVPVRTYKADEIPLVSFRFKF